MRYIVSLSGGASSAVAADRVIQKHGMGKATLWFADTMAEDEDLYRFLSDCLVRWGNQIAAEFILSGRKREPDNIPVTRRVGNFVYYCKGETPEMMAIRKHIIPNQRLAPCTFELKIDPFTNWIDRVRGQGTFAIALGYNPLEIDRVRRRARWHKDGKKWRRPQGYQARFYGVYETYPLLWSPRVFDPFSIINDWGIEIPALYREGFSNNNCNGECWRGGIAHWNRLRVMRPDAFNRKKEFEAMMRERFSPDRAILRDQSGGKVRPMTLAELEQRATPIEANPVLDDNGACLCAI